MIRRLPRVLPGRVVWTLRFGSVLGIVGACAAITLQDRQPPTPPALANVGPHAQAVDETANPNDQERDTVGLFASPSERAERLLLQRQAEVERHLARLEQVRDANVLVDLPRQRGFHPSPGRASVLIETQSGHHLTFGLAASIRRIVESRFAELLTDDIAVIDRRTGLAVEPPRGATTRELETIDSWVSRRTAEYHASVTDVLAHRVGATAEVWATAEANDWYRAAAAESSGAAESGVTRLAGFGGEARATPFDDSFSVAIDLPRTEVLRQHPDAWQSLAAWQQAEAATIAELRQTVQQELPDLVPDQIRVRLVGPMPEPPPTPGLPISVWFGTVGVCGLIAGMSWTTPVRGFRR